MLSFKLWVLIFVWMVSLAPSTPWRDTYESTAITMALTVETEEPLYQNDDTRIRTAATLVALARYESVFDPNAWGDRGHGDSHGLYQQQRFGLLSDVGEATAVALSQIRISMRICRGRPVEERLTWYAAGGNGCESRDGVAKSRHRMTLAKKLAGEGT